MRQITVIVGTACSAILATTVGGSIVRWEESHPPGEDGEAIAPAEAVALESRQIMVPMMTAVIAAR
jgi:hypothetical protein